MLNTPCSADSASTEILVNTPPQAVAGPNFVCCENVESIFDGSSSFDSDGDALSYWWDFGDGATGQGAKATHMYIKGGKYSVTLKVDDNSGTGCSISTTAFEVQVNDQPIPVIRVK